MIDIEGGLIATKCLNESPSQKEGKSVKVIDGAGVVLGLNESPSQKEGKLSC